MSLSSFISFTASLFLAASVAAMGLSPMTATLKVSNGQLYDYIVIGEHPKATEGFDNAYDIISPGNLNADMGEPYISVVAPHPEWKPAREMRNDIRSPAAKMMWEVSIRSSLPVGIPLWIELDPDQSRMPRGTRLTIEDQKRHIVLDGHKCSIPAPGPGKTEKLLLIVEQQ
ncbi:hypothetical protein [Geomonas oryzae]|uniref:hypothetical protein n=1 Tax=Geomonas oryzae TaxID=2364273 RepID=UPI00100A363A|nr:hypothetical protein [Geomonas oryzae]